MGPEPRGHGRDNEEAYTYLGLDDIRWNYEVLHNKSTVNRTIEEKVNYVCSLCSVTIASLSLRHCAAVQVQQAQENT